MNSKKVQRINTPLQHSMFSYMSSDENRVPINLYRLVGSEDLGQSHTM